MENLVYQKYLKIKYENCLGCLYDDPSQIKHTCCTDDCDYFYIKEAINYYKDRGELSETAANIIYNGWYRKYIEKDNLQSLTQLKDL